MDVEPRPVLLYASQKNENTYFKNRLREEVNVQPKSEHGLGFVRNGHYRKT